MINTHYDMIHNLILKLYGRDTEITFLEIGVCSGSMERMLIHEFPNIKVIGIDFRDCPFDENELKRITYIKKKSDEAVSDIADGSIDFVYIDGDHSYEQCRRDIIHYLAKVKHGGIIAGHDYVEQHWGVIKAVTEILGKVEYGNDLTWFKNVPV